MFLRSNISDEKTTSGMMADEAGDGGVAGVARTTVTLPLAGVVSEGRFAVLKPLPAAVASASSSSITRSDNSSTVTGSVAVAYVLPQLALE